MGIYEKLSMIQCELKAPKNQKNSFGGYNYRSAEDILENVKPICNKYKTTLILTDKVVSVNESNPRFYVEATAKLFDWESDAVIEVTAFAREAEVKKGMDDSQITGTASSYARKYAMNGLFNIDDTKDADTDSYQRQTLTEEKPATEKQLKLLKSKVKSDMQVEWVMDKYNVTSLEQLTMRRASELIETIKSKEAQNA